MNQAIGGPFGVALDTPVVLGEAVVALEPHAPRREVGDGGVDVGHREVEDRERRGHVVRLRVHEHVSPAGQMQREQTVGFGHVEPEHTGVELPRRREVVDREAAERRRRGQRPVRPSRTRSVTADGAG